MPRIVNNDGHLMVQTTSSYEVRDPESVLIEIAGWRPKPDVDVERDRSGVLSHLEANYQRKPLAIRGPGARVLGAGVALNLAPYMALERFWIERM